MLKTLIGGSWSFVSWIMSGAIILRCPKYRRARLCQIFGSSWNFFGRRKRKNNKTKEKKQKTAGLKPKSTYYN